MEATERFGEFGSNIWGRMTSTPLGSLSKREIELSLLQAALDAGLVSASPAELATVFRISLSKTRSYLNDLAVRSEPLQDDEALRMLQEHLVASEVMWDGRLLTIQFSDSRLFVWADRKLAGLHRISGETLGTNTLRISLVTLGALLDESSGVRGPAQTLDLLRSDFAETEWFQDARKILSPNSRWREYLGSISDGGSVMSHLVTLVSGAVG